MATFLQEAFGQISYGARGPSKDQINVQTVNYTDAEGFALEGYLALPPNTTQKVPAVLVLPNWDGTSGPFGHEAQRTRMIADELGYVAMGISGPLCPANSGGNRYSSKIYLTGYCFGGTGSIDYAFSANSLQNVKAVVPLHGGLNPLQAIKTDNVKPYVLVLSGGIDDAHGNPTKLELHYRRRRIHRRIRLFRFFGAKAALFLRFTSDNGYSFGRNLVLTDRCGDTGAIPRRLLRQMRFV